MTRESKSELTAFIGSRKEVNKEGEGIEQSGKDPSAPEEHLRRIKEFVLKNDQEIKRLEEKGANRTFEVRSYNDQLEKVYRDKIAELESGLGELSADTKSVIHKKMVEDMIKLERDLAKHYENLNGFRFVLSQEQYILERLHSVVDVIDTLQDEHPEVLALTILGSSVKGTARPDSDVDGFLYINQDAVREGYDQNKYASLIQQKIIEKKISPNQRENDIKVRFVNEQIVSTAIKDMLEVAKEGKLKELSDQKGDPETIIKKKSILIARRLLSSFFHMETGGGIGKYRLTILENLSQLGGLGEEVWKFIIGDTEANEQNFTTKSTDKVGYPRTLDEARFVYEKLEKNH